jgi:hypothetical protein
MFLGNFINKLILPDGISVDGTVLSVRLFLKTSEKTSNPVPQSSKNHPDKSSPVLMLTQDEVLVNPIRMPFRQKSPIFSAHRAHGCAGEKLPGRCSKPATHSS